MSTTVLYIAGTGRSGSTVLANVLGEVDGVFSAGEVRFLWQRGLAENRLCGCGLPVLECPVWSRVLADPRLRDGAAATSALLQHTQRLRRLPAIVAGRVLPGLDPARSPRESAGRDQLAALYASIARATGARVVVDSSKLPAYANLLSAVPGIDLRVVHLVRDPRGAAFSWTSTKALTDGAGRTHMERIGAAKSALLWDVWNSAAAGLLNRGRGTYIRLRYEDFVADPAAALRAVLAMVGLEEATLPLDGPSEVHLGVNHTVAGNPDRMRHGSIRIRADRRWVTGMPASERRLVTALTLPLLAGFGYPTRVVDDSGATETIFDRAPAGETAAARTRRRLRRHLRWGSTEGFGRLVEEDELNPVTRARVAAGKWRWRHANPVEPGSAMPVYLVGLQRSGTNMLARGLDTAPEFEVRNENDREAFHRFQLRSDDVVRRIVLRSHHRYVLFKPLCDSHRVDQLLDGITTPTPGRAIWAYRDVDGRVRSAVSKFGRNNLLTLRDIASGRGNGMWQAQRLSPATLEVIAGFDYDAMTAETAAALLWWARNGLYFEIGLDRRDDVCLASYQHMLSDPAAAMGSICDFLGLPYRPALTAHVGARPGRGKSVEIDPRVRALCDQLQSRLDDALGAQLRGRAA